MIRIDVRSNIKDFTRHLTTIEKKQIPFATMRTINDTAFQVRRRIVERTYPRAFHVRNRRFAAITFRVKKATKRNLAALVFDRTGRGALALHAEGGTKRPFGKHLAIPTLNIKRTKSGKIGKAKRPSTLILSGKGFKGKTRSGKAAIYQRLGRKGKKIKLMYTLATSARIDKRFPFYEDANLTASRSFKNNFRRNLARALATAR